MMTPGPQRALADYLAFLEHLSPRSLPLLDKMLSSDIRFTDPFHDLIGIDGVRAVYQKRFALYRRVKFQTVGYGFARDGHTAYIRWTLDLDDHRIDGMSEMTFTGDGKIAAQADYWDSGAGVMAGLALAGFVWRRVRQKFSAG